MKSLISAFAVAAAMGIAAAAALGLSTSAAMANSPRCNAVAVPYHGISAVYPCGNSFLAGFHVRYEHYGTDREAPGQPIVETPSEEPKEHYCPPRGSWSTNQS